MAYFLNECDAAALAANLVEVRPVASNASETSIFGILTGAAAYAQHYSEQKKKAPNAFLRFNASKGGNDGALELVVRTHNEHLGHLLLEQASTGRFDFVMSFILDISSRFLDFEPKIHRFSKASLGLSYP